MTKNNAFLNFIAVFAATALIGACAGTQTQDTPLPKAETAPQSPTSSQEYAEGAVKKLRPHLGFLDEKQREETLASYRTIYFNFLERHPEQPRAEKIQTLMEMVEETIQTLGAKEVKDKKCVIERDFISAEIMPLLGEIEGLYKRQLSRAQIPSSEISALQEKVKTLDNLDKRIAQLCRPFKDTLRLLNNEARLDAGYVLNGGTAPGKAVPDQDSEVDELLNDGNSSDK